MNLSFATLRETKKSVILLIYDRNLLEYCVKRKSYSEFLDSLGYSKDLIKIVSLLDINNS